MLPILAALLLLPTLSSALTPDSLDMHVSDFQMYVRAGNFNNRGWYWGGAPTLNHQSEFYNCITEGQLIGDNTTLITNNSPTTTTSTTPTPTSVVKFCWIWQIREAEADLYSSGTCQCNSNTGRFCDDWTCVQVVEEQAGDGDLDFTKYKDCQCTNASVSGDYCQAWTCMGYGDGATKTANWQCTVPASVEFPKLGITHDWCFHFIDDEFSTEVQEAKECECTQYNNDYCVRWTCAQVDLPVWPWWTPILGSLLGAVLNVWIPPIMVNSSCVGVVLCSLWLPCTYLVIVLVGGYASLIANTTLLLLLFCICFSVKRLIPWLKKRRSAAGERNRDIHMHTIRPIASAPVVPPPPVVPSEDDLEGKAV